MKTSLVYRRDDYYEHSYARVNHRVLSDYTDAVTPVGTGRVAAHDFIEHIGGCPSGSVEDELAAFGVIAAGRLQCGMLDYGFCYVPDAGIAREIRNFMDNDWEETIVLAPRRRTHHWQSGHCEWIAESVAAELNQPELERPILAWMEHGIRVAEKRFGSIDQAVNLYQQISETFDRMVEKHLDAFAIRIDNNEVWGESRDPYWG